MVSGAITKEEEIGSEKVINDRLKSPPGIRGQEILIFVTSEKRSFRIMRMGTWNCVIEW